MPRNVELLCMIFLYLSNTINPFIYAGMNPAFKSEIRKILFCKRKPKVSIVSGGEEAKIDEVPKEIGKHRRDEKNKCETLFLLSLFWRT